MRRHFRLPPWSDFVEVHWGRGVEAYVTPVGPDRVGIAFLWSAAGAADKDYAAFLARFPALRDHLGPAAGAPETSLMGAGPFETSVNGVVRGRVVLVGDASGYFDAITGEGLSQAFASAAALVEAIAGEDASSYPRAWARIRRRHIFLTRCVLALATQERLRRRVLKVLRDHPRAFQRLLALNTGTSGWCRALPGLLKIGIRLAF